MFGWYLRKNSILPRNRKFRTSTNTTAMLAKTTENWILVGGMGDVGSLAAMATAFHAATVGAGNSHSPVASSASWEAMMHGYALVNKTNTAGATRVATNVPSSCAMYCGLGGVLSRKPTRKSPTRSAIVPRVS